MTNSVLSPVKVRLMAWKPKPFQRSKIKPPSLIVVLLWAFAEKTEVTGNLVLQCLYPQPLVGEAALGSVTTQHGGDCSSGTSAPVFFRGTAGCFCGYKATWAVRSKQAFASRLELKWADRHHYSITGLFLMFLWRLFLSLTFGVITVVLV